MWGNLDYHGTPWQLNTAAATEDEGVISDETDQTSRITSRRLKGFKDILTGEDEQTDGYVYDLAGNLVFDGRHVYTYDAWSRLVAVSLDGGAEPDETTAYVVPRRESGETVPLRPPDGPARDSAVLT